MRLLPAHVANLRGESFGPENGSLEEYWVVLQKRSGTSLAVRKGIPFERASRCR